MITQQWLRENLHYDEHAGLFTWARKQSNKIGVGTPAGCARGSYGYVKIKILGHSYRAHRLAFLYMTGAVPRFIDHINGNRADNRWVNLRECTKSQNGMNRAIARNNKTGVTGVCFVQETGKWRAYCYANRVRYHVGTFSSMDAAIQARRKFEQAMHGEFAAALSRAGGVDERKAVINGIRSQLDLFADNRRIFFASNGSILEPQL